jgi:hypothetical protein
MGNNPVFDQKIRRGNMDKLRPNLSLISKYNPSCFHFTDKTISGNTVIWGKSGFWINQLFNEFGQDFITGTPTQNVFKLDNSQNTSETVLGYKIDPCLIVSGSWHSDAQDKFNLFHVISPPPHWDYQNPLSSYTVWKDAVGFSIDFLRCYRWCPMFSCPEPDIVFGVDPITKKPAKSSVGVSLSVVVKNSTRNPPQYETWGEKKGGGEVLIAKEVGGTPEYLMNGEKPGSVLLENVEFHPVQNVQEPVEDYHYNFEFTPQVLKNPYYTLRQVRVTVLIPGDTGITHFYKAGPTSTPLKIDCKGVGFFLIGKVCPILE